MLSMHSIRATAGSRDLQSAIDLFVSFFQDFSDLDKELLVDWYQNMSDGRWLSLIRNTGGFLETYNVTKKDIFLNRLRLQGHFLVLNRVKSTSIFCKFELVLDFFFRNCDCPNRLKRCNLRKQFYTRYTIECNHIQYAIWFNLLRSRISRQLSNRAAHLGCVVDTRAQPTIYLSFLYPSYLISFRTIV